MKVIFKNELRKWIICLGEHAVGKCIIPGMFDPIIPAELKEEMSSQKSNSKHYVTD